MCGEHPMCALRSASARRDHPRMCGEHGWSLVVLRSVWGSSPHVRGTHIRRNPPRTAYGIIPACAGNTLSKSTAMRGIGDHPRMCGEHISPPSIGSPVPGSSPHVRGTPVNSVAPSVAAGIIPACAGNTSRWRFAPWCGWDHPRMCGEHTLGYSFCSFTWGSSPHVRGTRSARNG